MKIKRRKFPSRPLRVDMIASGYEWTCPRCEKLNTECEYTETVTCCVTEIEQMRYDDTIDAIVETGMLTPAQARQLHTIPQGCGADFETNLPHERRN